MKYIHNVKNHKRQARFGFGINLFLIRSFVQLFDKDTRISQVYINNLISPCANHFKFIKQCFWRQYTGQVRIFIFFSFMVPELYPWFNWKKNNCDFHSFTSVFWNYYRLFWTTIHRSSSMLAIIPFMDPASSYSFVYFMQKRGHPGHMDTLFHVKANYHRSSYMSLSQSLMARYEK